MARLDPSDLEHPIVGAPLAGGPTTSELAAAVSDAGGLGFLAAGYRTAEVLRDGLDAARVLTGRAVGVNLFVFADPPPAPGAVERYAEALRPEAERYGVELGEPRPDDDDDLEAKLDLVEERQVPVVSFTFACPAAETVARLQRAGSAVWATVATPAEAAAARDAGVDALVLQGTEAGGHRAYFGDSEPEELGVLALLRLVAAEVELPLIAAGGLGDREAVAGVLAAGAVAAQLGTAFMLAPEAGTAQAHREVLGTRAPTALTRAFSGRNARGVVNRFMAEHSAEAPSGFPAIHHLTAPLRAAARESGDAEGLHLWAGQAHRLAEARPAREIVRRLSPV